MTCDPFVATAEWLSCINHETHNVDIADAVESGRVDTFAKRSLRLVEPGCIHKDQL